MSSSSDLLLANQRRLQEEADKVVELLELPAILGAIGTPVRVGSSALGLMVRRDIDITVICKELDVGTRTAFAQLAAQLTLMDRYVLSVRFRNDSGVWNAEPAAYPDGLYLGVSAKVDGADWTLDIWAVDQPGRQPDLTHLRTLRPRLNDDLRRTILTIEQELIADGPTRLDQRNIPSAHVYDAVVDGGISSLAEFREWLTARNKNPR